MILDWTSEGMDWEGIHFGGDRLRGILMLPYMEALRLAIVERASVVQHAGPVLDLLLEPVEEGVLKSREWADEFSATMAHLVHKYVDPTNGLSSGNAGIRRWNNNTGPGYEAAGTPLGDNSRFIFTFLGQELEGNPAIAVSQAGILITAKWAAQQYDVLNLLIWSMHHDENGNTQMTDVGNADTDERRTGDGADFTDAVDDFDLAPWVLSGGGIPGPYHWARGTGGPSREVARVRLNDDWECKELPSNVYAPGDVRFTEFKKTWHAIGHMQAPPPSLIGAAASTYQNNDYAVPENGYNIFTENTTPNYDSATGNASWGDFDTVTATNPPNGAVNGWHVDPEDSFNLFGTADPVTPPGGMFVILKWDQDPVDGFQFVA